MLSDRFKQVLFALGMTSALSCGGVTVSELRAENPNADTVVVPCRPTKINGQPEKWALRVKTGHIVTDDQPDELRAFMPYADVLFIHAEEASVANAEMMASHYGLACPSDVLAQVAEAESLRKKPCPHGVAQTKGPTNPNLLAEPGKEDCNPAAKPKKVQARVRVCAAPPGSPKGLTRWGSHDSKGKLLTNDEKVFADAIANADILFILDDKAPAETIYWFVKDPSELQCPGKTPMPYAKATASGRLAMMAAAATMGDALNPSEKTGDGKTSDSSSPDGTGPELSVFEKIARGLSLAGALAQGDVSGDAKDPNGHRNGMPGGTNVGGFSFPLLQAGVATFHIISAAGLKPKDFIDIVNAASKKGQRGLIMKADKEALKLADDLIGTYEQFPMAKGLQEMQTVMPYELGAKFTQGLENKFQAHKILERRALEKLKRDKDFNKLPSVILTDAEHKHVTKLLNDAWKTHAPDPRQKVTVAQLRAIYNEAYKGYPHWLEIIEKQLQ